MSGVVGDGRAGSIPAPAAARGRLRKGGLRPFRPGPTETLRALYQRYCDTEARELLTLLPREGLRALWARARERQGPGGSAPGADRIPGEPPGDALDLLRAEARSLLPLPPYEVWVKAYLSSRTLFLERMGVASAPERAGPVTVAVRPVNAVWWAHLNLERREWEWVGHLAFHAGVHSDAGDGEPAPALRSANGLRTADIFRGESPEEIRQRFREFNAHALEAFLRSVSPQTA